MKNLLTWFVVILVVVLVAFFIFNNNSDSADSNDDSGEQTKDEMPEGEVSDLSSDDEVFTGIDEGVDNF